MRKFIKILLLLVFIIPCWAASAFADTATSNNVFGTVINKGLDLFVNIRSIVFVLAGFGLVGLSVASIFGRPMWKWFGFLATGLIAVSVAGGIVKYMTDVDDSSTVASLDFKDTLGKGASSTSVDPATY